MGQVKEEEKVCREVEKIVKSAGDTGRGDREEGFFFWLWVFRFFINVFYFILFILFVMESTSGKKVSLTNTTSAFNRLTNGLANGWRNL
ncbi:hypothetical protein PRUPE_1G248700 [Prunus persica]|uniref:Uncharacterized protein n=1 Tax=Prunus persica TaxID=3760 RepID=A0A251R2V0_PRUPE|nr:hypothetical protein PRUPE_1G248700 [Prunus persica]